MSDEQIGARFGRVMATGLSEPEEVRANTAAILAQDTRDSIATLTVREAAAYFGVNNGALWGFLRRYKEAGNEPPAVYKKPTGARSGKRTADAYLISFWETIIPQESRDTSATVAQKTRGDGASIAQESREVNASEFADIRLVIDALKESHARELQTRDRLIETLEANAAVLQETNRNQGQRIGELRQENSEIKAERDAAKERADRAEAENREKDAEIERLLSRGFWARLLGR